MLNFAIMKRWENWVTIFLMLLIATFAVNVVSRKLLG